MILMDNIEASKLNDYLTHGQNKAYDLTMSGKKGIRTFRCLMLQI